MKKEETNKKSGQVLLITIMLLATALTIVLSITFTSTTETQVTKLEEESQRTLAAAEAGIEKLLQSGADTINIRDIGGNEFNDFKGTAAITRTQGVIFTTPLLRKDEQYTFYLSNYNEDSKIITGDLYADEIIISAADGYNICSPSENQFAVELTFINTTTGAIKRNVVYEDDISCNPPVIQGDITFGAVYDVPDPGYHMLILRIITPNIINGVKLSINNNKTSENPWPAQGRYITSEAQSQTGTTKKVQLFQSYPQIPADFFVTSF